MKCGCQWPVQPCALCTGRPDPTQPRDLPDTMPASERVGLLDPGFHPVLSFPEGESILIFFPRSILSNVSVLSNRSPHEIFIVNLVFSFGVGRKNIVTDLFR